MSPKKLEKFSNYLLVSEYELAIVLKKRAILIGSKLVNLFIATQLIFLSGGSLLAILLATLILLISSLTMDFLVKKTDKLIYVMINSISFVAIPIFIDPFITKPWISYGLLIVLFILFAIGIDNKIFYFLIVLTAILLQYFVANLELIGINDRKDLLLLNTYFSTLWVIVFGFGIYYVNVKYSEYCQEIDKKLFDLQDEFYEQSKLDSQINSSDNKNLTLHGTILNTLISYNQLPDSAFSKTAFMSDLDKDIGKIKLNQNFQNNNSSFLRFIDSELSAYGLKINYYVEQDIKLDKELAGPAIEILREICLNTKKHTTSTELNIYIRGSSDDFNIKVEEIIPTLISLTEIENKLSRARSSKTLDRLVKSVGINLIIDYSAAYDKLVFRCHLSKENHAKKVLINVRIIRENSVARNFDLYVRVSFFYSILAIIGFFLIDIPIYVLYSLTLAVCLMYAEIVAARKTTWRPLISQTIILTLIPYEIFSKNSCENLLYTPWLFNSVFALILYGIWSFKHTVMKFVTPIIFIIENFFTRFFFPEQCNTLLDGSTPGFLLILLLGFQIARLRKRNIEMDSELDRSLLYQLEQSKIIAGQIELERARVVEDIRLFMQKHKDSQNSVKELKSAITFLIQRIRVFLICSEFYASPFIQTIYKFAVDRISVGWSTKISIYTNQITDQYSLDLKALEELNLQSKEKLVELVITNDQQLAMLYLLDNQEIAEFILTN